MSNTFISQDIPGYDGAYTITEGGDVFSTHSHSLLRHRRRRDGYRTVVLSKAGKAQTYLVHRLVYRVFRGPVGRKVFVLPVDGDRSNVSLDNLVAVPAKRYFATRATLALKVKTRSSPTRKKVGRRGR